MKSWNIPIIPCYIHFALLGDDSDVTVLTNYFRIYPKGGSCGICVNPFTITCASNGMFARLIPGWVDLHLVLLISKDNFRITA